MRSIGRRRALAVLQDERTWLWQAPSSRPIRYVPKRRIAVLLGVVLTLVLPEQPSENVLVALVIRLERSDLVPRLRLTRKPSVEFGHL